jgi:3-phenylpropionate/trans-cinnamate dioxygenase ferredoxin reductase subunit
VGSEPHLPYDRPPLSKQFLLGTMGLEQIRLRSEQELTDLGIELRLRSTAEALDETGVRLDDGTRIDADRVVIATGVSPRALPAQPSAASVGMLRTLDDSQWLAGRLGLGAPIAVVGGGFIGAEVASAARAHGVDAVVLEACSEPMERVLGVAGGRLFRQLWLQHGVDVRGDVVVRRIDADDVTATVVLGDAPTDVLRVGTVVVGIGSRPNTGWLGEIAEADGAVRCDEVGRISKHPSAYAAGDIAAWSDRDGTHRRVEHWTSARHQAAVVAAHICAAPLSNEEMASYFWTDQFGLKIQVLGRTDGADDVIVVQPDADRVGRSAVLYVAQGHPVGVALFGAPRLLGKCNAALVARADTGELLAELRNGLT